MKIKISIEQKQFLVLLADYLYSHRSSTFEPQLNWQNLLQISDAHQMTDIIFYQCKRYLETASTLQEVKQHLISNQASHLYIMANRNRAFQHLEKKLTELNIPRKCSREDERYDCITNEI